MAKNGHIASWTLEAIKKRLDEAQSLGMAEAVSVLQMYTKFRDILDWTER